MDTLPAADLPLDTLLTPARLDDTRFRWVVPDGWQQGRGAFGGLVLGAMVRALEEVAGPGRPLRSLTAELPGPTLPGPVELRVETLRAGSGVSTLAARLVQGGEVQAHAVAVLGKPRATDCDLASTAPVTPHWRELEAVTIGPPFGPDFAKYFEFWNAGPLPFSHTPDATARGWVRHRNPGRCDAAWAVAHVDAWWPAMSTRFEAPRPVGTVAFTFQLAGSLEGLDPGAPVFYSATDLVIREGFAVEQRELRAEDGRLLALNQQTIALIR